jgi:YbbR domain-containing protein
MSQQIPVNINRVINLITLNSPAKILSLAMAIFLFTFHNINLLKTKTISSKLQIEGYTNLIITNIVPESVSVKLRGGENDIANISGDDIITFIDLSGYKLTGSYNSPVRIIKNGHALNIDTLEISVEPADILLQLDKSASKSVKISPDISGMPASGYDIVSESVKPDTAQIEGPASLLDSISVIMTETINITGRYNDFSLVSPLVQPGPLFTILGGNTVEYSAKVSSANIEKVFSDISVTPLNLDENFTARIQPETGEITFKGKYSDINDFTPDSNTLTVDLSDIKDEGDIELPVKAAAGKPEELYSYEPKTVTVKIIKREN